MFNHSPQLIRTLKIVDENLYPRIHTYINTNTCIQSLFFKIYQNFQGSWNRNVYKNLYFRFFCDYYKNKIYSWVYIKDLKYINQSLSLCRIFIEWFFLIAFISYSSQRLFFAIFVIIISKMLLVNVKFLYPMQWSRSPLIFSTISFHKYSTDIMRLQTNIQYCVKWCIKNNYFFVYFLYHFKIYCRK